MWTQMPLLSAKWEVQVWRTLAKGEMGREKGERWKNEMSLGWKKGDEERRGVGKTGEGCKKGEDFNPLSSPSKGPNSKSVHEIWLKMELDLYIMYILSEN